MHNVHSMIVNEQYHVFPGTGLTVCCLKLRDGRVVTGESMASNLRKFDVALGRRVARQNACAKILVTCQNSL